MAPEPTYSVSSVNSDSSVNTCSICFEHINGGFLCRCLKYVCDNCKNEMESHQITKCPHCRQPLSIYKTYTIKSYYYNLIGLFILLICKIFGQLWYPIYLINSADIPSIMIITLSPMIIEPYNILYGCIFDKYIHIKFIIANIVLLIYNIIMITLINITDPNSIHAFIIYNTLILYYAPFVIIIFIQVLGKYMDIHSILRKTIKMYITIEPLVISEVMI